VSGNKNKFTLLRRSPSLVSLRAFESVARQGSVTGAAAELNVTPAAVSQQIRLLEDMVGKPLFRRHKRKLVLTEVGESCLPELRKCFEHLLRAISLAEGHQARQTFNLSVPPSFAVRWLVPHFAELTAGIENCNFRVSTSLVPFHLDDSGIDLAITHGTGTFFDQGCELLIPASDIPVCRPDLLDRHPVSEPADLRHHHLLHETAEVYDPAVPDWKKWLAEHGASDIDHESGTYLSNPNLVIEAALAGLGVALARGALVKQELSDGRLVQVLDASARRDAGYYIVHNQRCGQPEIARVLSENFKKMVARYGGG